MSVVTGPYKELQAAAAPVAAATWYACTNTITGVRGSNTLRLYVAGTVASLGDVDFYLTHVYPGDSTSTAYTRAAAGDGPEVFGPIPFSGVGNYFVDIPIGIPLETVQVYYRIGSVASNPKIAISGLCYLDESGTSNAEISVGDIEVDVAAIEALITASNVLLGTIDSGTNTIQGDTTAIEVANVPLMGTTVDVDFDGSVASAAVVAAGPVMLCATEDCYCVWGAAPTAAAAAPSWYLPAGVMFVVESDGTKIAAIKRAVAGKLSITPLT